jgi:hypothetical protein
MHARYFKNSHYFCNKMFENSSYAAIRTSEVFFPGSFGLKTDPRADHTFRRGTSRTSSYPVSYHGRLYIFFFFKKKATCIAWVAGRSLLSHTSVTSFVIPQNSDTLLFVAVVLGYRIVSICGPRIRAPSVSAHLGCAAACSRPPR